MKLLSRSLALVSTALVGTLSSFAALALPPAQVRSTLAPIPVYTITDNEGKPLIANVPSANNPNVTESIAGVFISRQDADAFLNQLRSNNPQLASTVRVVPVSLAEINDLANQSREQPNPIIFTFIPQAAQVEQAMAILRQANPNVPRFEGVPLFAARTTQDQGYLTVTLENRQVIPFFFEREQLQELVDRFRSEQPNLANNIQIQVIPLEGVIQTLQQSNNPELARIVLWPSREALQFLLSQPRSTPQPSPTPRVSPSPSR